MNDLGEAASGLAQPVVDQDSRSGLDARPVSSLWILGTMLILLAVIAGVAFLLKPRGAVLEAAEARAELFRDVADPLPFGLVVKEARRLPAHEIVLTYARGEDGAAGAAAAATASPVQLTFMHFPEQRAESVLEDQFQKLRFETAGGGSRGRGGGGRGGQRGGGRSSSGGGEKSGGSPKPKLQDAGFLDWQGFSANYARLLHTVPNPKQGPKQDSKEGPSGDSTAAGGPPKGGKPGSGSKKPKTYETVRVNLSTGGRCIIAYVRFPEGVAGSKEIVSDLLSSFSPLPAH